MHPNQVKIRHRKPFIVYAYAIGQALGFYRLQRFENGQKHFLIVNNIHDNLPGK